MGDGIDADQGGPARLDAGLLFTDGLPQEADAVGYRGPTACAAAGITYRQLDYWARTDLIRPSLADAPGSGSQRLYSFRDILLLKVIKRLLDAGISLQQIRTAVQQQLEALCSEVQPAAGSGGWPVEDVDPALHECMDAVRTHQIEELRRLLAQSVLRLGLGRFVIDLVAPLNVAIGEAWVKGQLQVFEEHLYSEALQGVLRSAIAQVPVPVGEEGPRVLLTTLPGEPHGLGLLMAQVLFALEGCRVLSLGVQTPMQDIVQAAAAHRSDIVGLSFSASLNPVQVLDGLADLRAALPETVELWAGGSAPVLQRRPPGGVRVVSDLAAIPAGLQAWRKADARRDRPQAQ